MFARCDFLLVFIMMCPPRKLLEIYSALEAEQTVLTENLNKNKIKGEAT